MGRIQLQRHSYRNKEDHKAILSPVPINADLIRYRIPFIPAKAIFNIR